MPKEQRVAFITGCSERTSLGAAFALELKSKGWRVFVTARKIETLEELRAEGCEPLALDVTDALSIKAAGSHVKESAGRLDLLINNAGVAAQAPLLDIDVARAKAMYDVNVWGPILVVQAFADLLIKTANSPSLNGPKGFTTIVNIGSTARWIAPWQGAYGASKSAISHISDTMRVELGPLGVKVVRVDLSATRTAMSDKQKPFPINKAEPSPYYNYDVVIRPKQEKMFEGALKNAPDAREAAQQILRATEKRSPPIRLLIGGSAWIFAWIFPLLSEGMIDKAFAKMLSVTEIRRPRIA